MDDRLLTDVEVANMLGISPRTVRAWRLKKTGPPFKKIGRLVRYERSKVQECFGLTKVGGK